MQTDHPVVVKTAFRGMTHVSTVVANTAARPSAQILVLVCCFVWLVAGGSTATLASAASIGSLVLTQMVLSQQRRREIALHLKIDELILAKTGARDEVAGIERKTEEEIEELREGRSPEQR